MKKYQKVAKDIKRNQKTSKESKRHQKTSKDIKRHQKTSKDIKRHQKTRKPLKICFNDGIELKRHKNTPREIKRHQNTSREFKIHQERSKDINFSKKNMGTLMKYTHVAKYRKTFRLMRQICFNGGIDDAWHREYRLRPEKNASVLSRQLCMQISGGLWSFWKGATRLVRFYHFQGITNVMVKAPAGSQDIVNFVSCL